MKSVPNKLILIPFSCKRAKTGLRSRFYLNCSHLVKEPNLKECVIKGDNWSVKNPTKNPLCILNPEVVLITVWGSFFQLSGNIMGCHRQLVLFWVQLHGIFQFL